MFVKISSLFLCLFFIQSIFNLVAGDEMQVVGYKKDVYEGSELHLKCDYYSEKGVSDVETWWSQNGKKISDVKKSVYLHFNNVTSKDNGNYTCNGRLEAGEDELNKTVVIKVIEPTITPEKATYTAKLHANVTLSCIVKTQAVNSHTWYKLDDSENNVGRFNNLEAKYNLNDTHYSVNLHLKNVTRSDTGSYVCSAQIGHRNITSQTQLKVLERPEIKKFNVRPIQTGIFRLEWTLFDGNSPVSEYDIQVKAETAGKYVDSDRFNATNCTSCSHDLALKKRLDKSKKYLFRITAQNSEGKSPPAESIPINISAIDPMDTIPMEFNTTSTEHSIRIIWQRKNLNPLSSYYYKINLTNSLKPGSQNHTYKSKKNATEYEIPKLMPSTAYLIKVQGCLDGNDSRATKCTNWTHRNVTTMTSGSGSSVSHSAGGFNLITLTTILSMFLFKYDNVRSFLSL